MVRVPQNIPNTVDALIVTCLSILILYPSAPKPSFANVKQISPLDGFPSLTRIALPNRRS